MDGTYQNVIEIAVKTQQIRPYAGRITLMIWHDKTHFDEWVNLAETRDDVRVISVPTTLLPIALLDRAEMAFVGVAFGKQANYIDTVIKYCMVMQQI